MYFSLKFGILCKWMDNRLSYQNLNVDYRENSVPWAVAHNMIWTPKFTFSNHNEKDPEKQVLKHIESSTLVIFKNGNGKHADVSQIDEAKVYNSSEIELSMKTFHFMKFHCDFDLTNFPFDRQTCYVEVKI